MHFVLIWQNLFATKNEKDCDFENFTLTITFGRFYQIT